MIYFPPPLPVPEEQQELEAAALVTKHREEIDHIRNLPEEEQAAALSYYGFTPDIQQRFSDYAEYDKLLQKEDIAARRKTAIIGIGTSLLALAGITWIRQSISPSTLVQAAVMTLIPAATGTISGAVASRVFRHKIAENSRQNVIEMNIFLEQTLARAIEEKTRDLSPAPAPAPEPLPQPETIHSHNVTPRAPGFAMAEEARKATDITETAAPGR